MKTVLLGLQAFTYVALGTLLVVEGFWQLGVSQILLAAVQILIYS